MFIDYLNLTEDCELCGDKEKNPKRFNELMQELKRSVALLLFTPFLIILIVDVFLLAAVYWVNILEFSSGF
jgi:hypothetical protein